MISGRFRKHIEHKFQTSFDEWSELMDMFEIYELQNEFDLQELRLKKLKRLDKWLTHYDLKE